MRESYRESLREIDTLMIEMTRLVGRAMSHATQALLDADLQEAEAVIAEDAKLDEINLEVDDRAFQVPLARQQPVAGQLRRLLSIFWRISNSVGADGRPRGARGQDDSAALPQLGGAGGIARRHLGHGGSGAARIVHQTGAALSPATTSSRPDMRWRQTRR